MWDFLKENWISVLALIVAFLGGVPGVISVVNYCRNRPIFGFEPSGILTGTIASNNRDILMLFGTVTNAGTKPLHPKAFNLKVKAEGKWTSLQRMVTPKTCVFNSERQKIEVKEPSKMDLQEWSRPITTEEPARGNLMFISDELDVKSLKDSDKITFQLTCVDIFKKKHTVTITYGPFANINEPVKLIKHGVSFGPKD